MTIMGYLRQLLKGKDSNPVLEYVNESRVRATDVEIDLTTPIESYDSGNEVDLANLTDLEAYARDSHISKKSIEQWISSGLLMPEELKTAEKLIKIMNKA